MERWWADLGAPQLTPDTIAKLNAGVLEEAAGRDFDALAGERDDKLIGILQALQAADRKPA